MFSMISGILGLFSKSITADKEVNQQIIEQRNNSLSDEIVVICVFIPVILLMFGIDVFPALAKVPEWYQAIIGITVIGIVGCNQVGNLRSKWKK